MYKFIPIVFLMGSIAPLYATSINTPVDFSNQAQTELPTPQNVPINTFGQWIIGWGTGAEGARQRLDYIQREDVVIIKQKGTTLEMLNQWQRHYEQEAQNNLNNPTARYRARLMKKIIELW